jgi:hypothetical protein
LEVDWARWTLVPRSHGYFGNEPDPESRVRRVRRDGKAATAEKHNRRATVVKLLKELAIFVQVSLAMLLFSGCEVRVAEIGVPGEFRPAVFSTSSHNISITDLPPGSLCAYQVRLMGGSTTFSDRSDQIIHRAA